MISAGERTPPTAKFSATSLRSRRTCRILQTLIHQAETERRLDRSLLARVISALGQVIALPGLSILPTSPCVYKFCSTGTLWWSTVVGRSSRPNPPRWGIYLRCDQRHRFRSTLVLRRRASQRHRLFSLRFIVSPLLHRQPASQRRAIGESHAPDITRGGGKRKTDAGWVGRRKSSRPSLGLRGRPMRPLAKRPILGL
jgi:hypothetical protein